MLKFAPEDRVLSATHSTSVTGSTCHMLQLSSGGYNIILLVAELTVHSKPTGLGLLCFFCFTFFSRRSNSNIKTIRIGQENDFF